MTSAGRHHQPLCLWRKCVAVFYCALPRGAVLSWCYALAALDAFLDSAWILDHVCVFGVRALFSLCASPRFVVNLALLLPLPRSLSPSLTFSLSESNSFLYTFCVLPPVSRMTKLFQEVTPPNAEPTEPEVWLEGLVTLLGHFCLGGGRHQQVLREGSSPTILVRLCNLPFR